MIYFLLAIGLILIILLSFTTYGLWIKHANTKFIKGFLLPGFIVHELSHALLCLVTGTTIKELNIFSSSSTGIKYDKPKVPFVFDFIIAATPIFACAFFIFFIPKILANPIHLSNTFPQELHFTLNGFFALIQHLYYAVLNNFCTFWRQFHLLNIRHIFYLLTIIVFTVSMSPQKQDIKYLIIGFILLSPILFFLDIVGIHLLKNGWLNFCIKELWGITTLTITALVSLLLITLIMMGLSKGYSVTLGRKGSGKTKSTNSKSKNTD